MSQSPKSETKPLTSEALIAMLSGGGKYTAFKQLLADKQNLWNLHEGHFGDLAAFRDGIKLRETYLNELYEALNGANGLTKKAFETMCARISSSMELSADELSQVLNALLSTIKLGNIFKFNADSKKRNVFFNINRRKSNNKFK